MSNHAIVVKAPKLAEVAEISIPKLRDDYIGIKVHAVALNPTDWKHVDFIAPPGSRIGCDYAGVVESIGSKVSKGFKLGDRVAGFAHGGNTGQPEDGAFGEHIVAKGDIQIQIPENLSFEEAATLGVGVTTVGQGLYQSLKLPLPNHPATTPFFVLVYGGSTATGSLAIQYAKLSGLKVVTTCSPHNFEYVKSLGAVEAFDYNSKTCAQDINKYTENKLEYAFDCISEGNGPSICARAIATSGGQYTNLLSVTKEDIHQINPNITVGATLGYTVVGESFQKGNHDFPAKAEDFEFGKMFWELSRELLQNGKLNVHKMSVNEGGKGLSGVLTGMQMMRDNQVSGKKLVYTL